MINILLNGCNGRMGSVVSESVKNFPELTIAAGVDKNTTVSKDYAIFPSLEECTAAFDVILDFSRADALNHILEYAISYKKPLVLCTTGYSNEDIKAIERASKEIAIFRSANMSIGINVINNILKKISPLLYENYDIEIIEKHHNQKIDSPSGTALLLANSIKSSIDEDTEFTYGRQGLKKRDHKEIGIHALRGGNIVGDHEVIFAGAGEVIEINHKAISREVFAIGALKACKYICSKSQGLYNMDDMININI